MSNYQQNLTKELRELLGDLPLKKREEVIIWIKKKVVESFKNGLSAAQMVKAYKNGKKLQKGLKESTK